MYSYDYRESRRGDSGDRWDDDRSRTLEPQNGYGREADRARLSRSRSRDRAPQYDIGHDGRDGANGLRSGGRQRVSKQRPQVSSDHWTQGPKETDAHKIEQRLKQIQYGYNTAGYDRYLQLVPKEKRQGYDIHPRTPDAYLEQSKRKWDGRVQKWRRELHKWDPVGINDATAITTAVLNSTDDAFSASSAGVMDKVDCNQLSKDDAMNDDNAYKNEQDDDDDDVL